MGILIRVVADICVEFATHHGSRALYIIIHLMLPTPLSTTKNLILHRGEQLLFGTQCAEGPRALP